MIWLKDWCVKLLWFDQHAMFTWDWGAILLNGPLQALPALIWLRLGVLLTQWVVQLAKWLANWCVKLLQFDQHTMFNWEWEAILVHGPPEALPALQTVDLAQNEFCFYPTLVNTALTNGMLFLPCGLAHTLCSSIDQFIAQCSSFPFFDSICMVVDSYALWVVARPCSRVHARRYWHGMRDC